MTLDTNGAVLEGARLASGNATFTYPPRTFVLDQNSLDSIPYRMEYVLCAVSLDSSKRGTDIGDPELFFNWSKNENGVVRFDFDGFARRWDTCPGSPPDIVGVVGNSPRVRIPVPDTTVLSAPYSIYLGSPTRIVTFVVSFVSNDANFGTPPSGVVELSQATGNLNFSAVDLANPSIVGSPVYSTRQSFGDRLKSKGNVGSLPSALSGDYDIFLNPIPGSGQFPRVRLGFASHLVPNEVANDASLGSPIAGTFNWSRSTGKVKFSATDVSANLSKSVYYDGVYFGKKYLSRVSLGISSGSFPTPSYSITDFVGLDDSTKYCLFSDQISGRYYFRVVISATPPTSSPSDGDVVIDSSTGNVYMSNADNSSYGYSVSAVDTVIPMENGIGFQIFRSGVNSSGFSVENDFVLSYAVDQQVLTDNLLASPFVMLPTSPLDDSSLVFSVDSSPGSTGTFAGELVSAADSSSSGLGYFVDFENRKLSFSFRKSTSLTLPQSTSQVKLLDPVIYEDGFEVNKNGVPIQSGVDFDFDPMAGLLEFIRPVGENDSDNILDVPGTFISPNLFRPSLNAQTLDSDFTLLVPSGPNSGAYPIISRIGNDFVVDGTFVSGSGVADVRHGAEIIADRVWADFLPPYKKFSVVRTTDGVPRTLSNSEFSVLATTSQINLVEPAAPGEKFFVSYISLDSPDFGVTVTPNARTEFAGFKIRQENALTSPGSSVVQINSDGLTVDTSRPFKIYVDGVTQEDGTYSFSAPGSISLSSIITTESVFVDYYVNEAIGGETNFNLLFSPADVDNPVIQAGSQSSSFNGDQRPFLLPGGALLIDGKEVIVLKSVSYDSQSDSTTVVFEEIPAVGTDLASKLKACLPIDGFYRVNESASVSVFSRNTNFFTVSGNAPYLPGMVVTVNEDPYLVSAVKYDASKDRTSVMTASPAKFSYITPRVTRTVRPVFLTSQSFNTGKPAHSGYPFHLALGGSRSRALRLGVDYNFSEGGSISLTDPLVFGDSLHAFYVGRVAQPAGTVFDLNYAYGVAPDATNGMRGQRLKASYTLLSPDTFFYRIETIQSFLPEVIQELQKSSSGGTGGPNIGNSSSLKTKDYGSASLYFDEQHLGNLDLVIARLLEFHNDLANGYEDLLANFDGRIVGAQSGRFRFDGNLSNPYRADTDSVTNDVDDLARLYDRIVLTGFYSFENRPVYGAMWETNQVSRLFPTKKKTVIPLNTNTGLVNVGKVLGSLGVEKISTVSNLVSARASAKFTTDSTGTILVIEENGNASTLSPSFEVGHDVRIQTRAGNDESDASIVAISGTGPFFITITPATLLTEGVVIRILDNPANAANHSYVPGRDFAVNLDDGSIINSTFPPPFDTTQVPIVGQELVEVDVVYQNSSTAPLRIPALDGLELSDGGIVATPPLSYVNELDLLAQEKKFLSDFGLASVSSGNVLTSTSTLRVGDVVYFLTGTNSGFYATVTSVAYPSAVVGSVFPFNTGDEEFYVRRKNFPHLQEVLDDLVNVLSLNVASPGPSISLPGTIENELSTIGRIIESFGPTLVQSSGSFSSNTLTDGNVDFIASKVTTSCFVVVNSGTNLGLYSITNVGTSTITVDSVLPFYPFVGGFGSYSIVKPWQFLSPKEFAFPNQFIRETQDWLDSTITWRNSYSSAGVSARIDAINARETSISNFISSIQGLLGKDDKIYDSRYLWLSARTDRKTGTLTRQKMASSQRVENTEKLLADQQKILITSRLM